VAPKPITLEHLTEMSKDCCIRMEIICLNKAFEKPEEIKINPPPEVADLKTSADGLNKAAKEAEAGASVAPKAAGAPAVGGIMGSALGALGKACDTVEAGVNQVAGQTKAAGLMAMAQVLEGSFKGLEEPFQTVAKDVMTTKKGELYNIFVEYINGFTFVEPVKIIRGDAPWNAENYKKVASDAITKTLCTLAEKELCQKLKPSVDAAIQDHTVTKTWNGAIGKFNNVYDAVTAGTGMSKEKMDEAGIKKVEIDLGMYITKEIYKQLVIIMATEEAATRANPAGKDKLAPKPKPISFAKLFSVTGLTEADYDEWAMGVQAV